MMAIVRFLLGALPLCLIIIVGGTQSAGFGKRIFHYDDICGGVEKEEGGGAASPISVIFKEVLMGRGGTGIHNEGPCVCFGIGVYEYHAAETCPTSPSPYSLPSSTLLHVADYPTCIHLRQDVRAFTKVSGNPEAFSPDSYPIHSHFARCDNEVVYSRRKRQDAAAAAAPPAAPAAPAAPAPAPAAGDGAAPATGGGGAGGSPSVTTKLSDEADEDFLNTGTEVGHELMRNQMNQYIESVIAKLTGLGAESGADKGSGSGRKYPVIKLLDYTKQIMQKTCTVVNPDFFDLALNSFINLQLETYHLKEPYIGYSAFKRIELAMTRCLTRAKPHMFIATSNGTAETISNGTNGKNKELCDNKLPTKATSQTVLYAGTENEEIRNITIPPYASSTLSENKIAEPLIETVWKMLVSSHSYCYMHFSDYFNDHHTYTVALLPMFTNAIQEIWLKGGEGYDLSGENKLYGGLLGDVKKIVGDVDLCVGASREVSPYPWFMNRPLLDKSNVWNRRRKRGANEGVVREEEEENVDIEIDVVARGTLDDQQAFVHECKREVEMKDICIGNPDV